MIGCIDSGETKAPNWGSVRRATPKNIINQSELRTDWGDGGGGGGEVRCDEEGNMVVFIGGAMGWGVWGEKKRGKSESFRKEKKNQSLLADD